MNEITTRIILIIFTAIISLLGRKYVEPILPEKKKAISYMRKFLLFNLKYTSNIILLILTFFIIEFGKIFILLNFWYFGNIFYYLIIDYVNKFLVNHAESIVLIGNEIDKINGTKN